MSELIIVVLWIAITARCRKATAYYNHSLIAQGALGRQAYLQKLVTVESLDSFVTAEHAMLEKTLATVDNWATKNIDGYRPPPPDLHLINASRQNLETAFLEAIRVNPQASRKYYLQIIDGSDYAAEQQLAWQDVCVTDYKYSFPFVNINMGQKVKALDVVATAADEPDYGLDMGLWSNNGSEVGGRYDFGEQTFADPADLVQSQAPFHLSFMHDKVLRQLSKPMRSNYALLRIKTYSDLAKLAKQTNHEYWACRFAGRALHYIHDLTVPFHASMTPGYSLPQVFGALAAKLCGFSKPYTTMFSDIACTHVMFEIMHYELLNSAYQRQDWSAFIYCSLTESTGEISAEIDDFYARDVVAREAYQLRYRAYYAVKSLVTEQKEFNEIVVASANSIYNSLPIRKGAKKIAENEFARVVNIVAANSGRHTRNFIHHLLK